MINRLAVAVGMALCLIPFAALAQQDPSETQEEGAEGTETEGMDVAEPRGDRVRTSTDPVAPGEVHTVVRGDTLWDLSQRYLGSPWYWPKVWSYNPEIANPHWIYPGNQVKFFPSGEEAPTQVEVGTGPGEPEEGVEAPVQTEEDSEQVTVAGRIGFIAPRSYRRHIIGFATSKEIEESGSLDASFAETEMLAVPDSAYVAYKRKSDARVGDRLLVFRTESTFSHPDSGARFYVTRFLGTLKVTEVPATKLVRARVAESWEPIVRGDMVGPAGEQTQRNVAPRPNDRAVKGVVMGTLEPMVVMGEHHFVVVDRGSSDGVQPGNTFTVVRQMDGHTNFERPTRVNADVPSEDVAECMAIEVKDKATACILTRSLREVVQGDRVEMRVGTSAPAARASR